MILIVTGTARYNGSQIRRPFLTMAASIKATLATLIAMLIVGLSLKTSGLFENSGTASFYVAAALLGFLGALVWMFVYRSNTEK
jgi:membrane associated rhomboid family serine protease